MSIENCKNLLCKASAVVLGLGLVALAVAAARGPMSGPRASHVAAEPQPFLPQLGSLIRVVHDVHAREARAHVRHVRAVRRRHDPKPRTKPGATISLYERTTNLVVFRRQGCSAAQRGATGVVILDFGKPSYNGHTYGTILFSGAFAGNGDITRAMLAYAQGYDRCLPRWSGDQISLARGTSNYHPSVPSVYRAGRKWARETMALQHMLRANHLDDHVISAAADDVEPAWDPSFWRTRDFYRGYADSRVGHALYNYGSLDGGIVSGYWNVHQAFYVTGGMRYARAIPEIYNSTMAREWAALAQAAKHRYHRPVRFAGVMTERTPSNHGVKPKDAHRMLVRQLAVQGRGRAAAVVPKAYTNITSY
jgi:hypothetical protein